MDGINGIIAGWQGIGAAWQAFWALLQPMGDLVTVACLRSVPQLCVWLDPGWMAWMSYRITINALVFGSANVWLCWKIHQIDRSLTWYYPGQAPETPLHTEKPEASKAGAAGKSDGLLQRFMRWLGFEQ